MRHTPRSATVLVVAALALAGCSNTLPTASERAPSPEVTAGADTTATMLTYPTTPTARWTSTLGQADDGFDSAATFSAPWIPWELMGLPVDPSPIDAGDVWIAAAGPSLLGLDPDTGERMWTYRPADGFLTDCDSTLLDGDLVCTVSDALTDSRRSAFVLLDVATGLEASRFDLPFPSRAFDLVGGELVVVMYTGPTSFPYDDPSSLPSDPYRVSRFAADGAEVWTTDIPFVFDDFACGECTEARTSANTSLVSVWIRGQSFLFDLDDGAPLWKSDDWFLDTTLTRDGAVISSNTWDAATPPQVTVLSADGSAIATLPSHFLLPPAAEVDEQPMLLMDGDGRLVELDAASGETTPTGVTWPASLGPPSATRIAEVLLVQGDMLNAYDLRQPDTVAWQAPPMGALVPSGDSTLLYALHTEGDADTARTSLRAVQVSDGATLWTLPLDEHDASSVGPRLGTAGGRLIIVDGPTMTALQP